MKKIASFTLLVTILLVSLQSAPVVAHPTVSTEAIDTVSDNNNTVTPNSHETNSTTPIFINVTDDADNVQQKIRTRNSTNGEGAIVNVDAYTNVTFRYAVAFSNDTVFDESNFSDYDYRLFADLPVVNTTSFNNTSSNDPMTLQNENSAIPLNFTGNNVTRTNYKLPYDSDTIIENATLYFMETNFALNTSAAYIPFYVNDIAHDGFGNEGSSGDPFNLLTTNNKYWNTSSRDEFYIQNEDVEIIGSAFNTEQNDTFGIRYRSVGGTITPQTQENFTRSGVNFTDTLTIDSFDPGTTFTWFSMAFLNDSLLNETRTIQAIDVKNVEIGDGSPTLELDIDSKPTNDVRIDNVFYSSNPVVNLTVIADVPKGNITFIRLTTDIGVQPVNLTASGNQSLTGGAINQTIDFSQQSNVNETDNVYNLTLYTETDKGLSVNQTIDVVIDADTPSGTLNVVGANTQEGIATITSDDGKVTFSLGQHDSLSGVRLTTLDFGDGESAEVTGLQNYTHTFTQFDKVYFVELYVMDFAGNNITTSLNLEIERNPIDATLFNYEFWIFVGGLILLVPIYIYAQEIYDWIRRLVRR